MVFSFGETVGGAADFRSWAGAVWKLMRAEDARIDPAHFRVPIQAEEVPGLFRRKRGIAVTPTPKGFEVEFQAYEARLLKTLLKTRYILAEWQVAHARPAEAIALYETILPLDPSAAVGTQAPRLLQVGVRE